ncbi:MAG TPA: cytochrome c [Conexibacter sp.]
MPKWIDGRLLLRRRMLPLCACLLAALATTAFAAGCGDSGDSDSSSGTVASTRRVVQVQRVRQDRWTYARARFNEICAGCHTLADAGARGRRYNLDAAGHQGLEETHVRYTISSGEPGMPAFRDVLSEREFEELVAYVSTVSTYEGGDDGWLGQLRLRGEGAGWTKADTDRLEAYARRIARERQRRGLAKLNKEVREARARADREQ